MGDIIKPVAQWIAANIPWAILIGVFIISLFFEISKIKVYPLKWLWKAISWPFRKIDEQRTQSFKNIVISFRSDIDEKLNGMTVVFDNKLNEMAISQTANCATVQSCFTDLERRFDTLEDRLKSLDDKQQEAEERLDLLAAARIKNHVLNFARQCRKGEAHSHEDFRNLFDECKAYDALVEKYNWKNNVYTHDFAYIESVYDDLNKSNGFLE